MAFTVIEFRGPNFCQLCAVLTLGIDRNVDGPQAVPMRKPSEGQSHRRCFWVGLNILSYS